VTSLAMTTFLVPDYDEAIAFFRDALDFTVVEDSDLGGGKRWVVVAGASGGRLLLARATDDRQRATIGQQTGGRVGWFLQSDDFTSDHSRMAAWGVEFTERPRQEAYGTVAVFKDPWGNAWDLIEHREAA
jgi:catechol 2,3-dioxygenase-like lactoylglutathione lyase family enzyme